MLQFKDWLLLSESIANNFDQFIADIKKYAQNNELELKTVEVSPQQKENIIKVLTDNKKESQDYLKYLLGFINTKSDARIEDYQQAIDVLIWAFENRVVNKQELVEYGWYNRGKNYKELVEKRTEASSFVSNRQEIRDKKAGVAETLSPVYENEKDKIKIYMSPKIISEKLNFNNMKDIRQFNKRKDVAARHKVLCKYGKGTEWCTADPEGDYHGHYASHDIYIIHVDEKPEYQFTGCTGQENDHQCQFMDQNDNSPDRDDFKLLSYEVYEAILALPKGQEFANFFKLKSAISPTERLKKIQSDRPDIYSKITKEYTITRSGSRNHQVGEFFDVICSLPFDQMKEILDYIFDNKVFEPHEATDNLYHMQGGQSPKQNLLDYLIERKDIDDGSITRFLYHIRISLDNIKKLLKYRKNIIHENFVTIMSITEDSIETAKILNDFIMTSVEPSKIKQLLLYNAKHKHFLTDDMIKKAFETDKIDFKSMIKSLVSSRKSGVDADMMHYYLKKFNVVIDPNDAKEFFEDRTSRLILNINDIEAIRMVLPFTSGKIKLEKIEHFVTHKELANMLVIGTSSHYRGKMNDGSFINLLYDIRKHLDPKKLHKEIWNTQNHWENSKIEVSTSFFGYLQMILKMFKNNPEDDVIRQALTEFIVTGIIVPDYNADTRSIIKEYAIIQQQRNDAFLSLPNHYEKVANQILSKLN